jgi:sulfopyruvate decarboxylase TPP-binding subunit
MVSGPGITEMLARLGVTDVVWLPDSLLGTWEAALAADERLRLLRVCREGEAWALAAGLFIGGRHPLVVMQCTGLFESGDALRNVLFDWRLPLWALVGYRSYLLAGSTDTARRFTEPVLAAWGLDTLLVESDAELEKLAAYYRSCRDAGRAGVGLVAEGRG